ncbi:asparagine synthase (glutamine-hydrolyzing) [Sulfurimonas sp. SWIR-19]|uniref:asparagine synthase (glutamine-hydrolyzing) n=1 Tax=Sulfurimonas sp. SWIR-19 TaxID=2878390 RepID=UPI001CF19929|nr:asparagine synthase (glutamine-hydrolyzing) [Sulfurimonas sp. SWIR-19]UCN01135.1 asparagine synthase (glutamine-hydrolyzing) [Sulfurimonas sp. SWIR-19]
MCGIVGFNSKNSLVLNSMLQSIKHRGPDDSGVYEEDSFSLGHVRLSILDLSSNAHQPMEFDNLVMVYNGEVYNFKEIKEELEECGYSFVSNSDSEVVLKAYHKWGIKAIDQFRGMFAVAIFDKVKKTVTLIRDRVGVKPLYYFFDGKDFVFASELKPIMKYKNDLTISKDALYEFFQFGYISSNLSIFENCYKLPAGHYATFNIQDLTLDLQQYWSIVPFFQKPKFKKSEDELVDELEKLLIESFRYRMVADVPVGVFLSGGIDSSLVAAILQKHFGNIHTFTIGFKEAKYNEATYAKEVAKHLGTIHTENFLSSNQAKEILNRFVDIYDEPFGDSSGIPTTLVSSIAKDAGVKVVLSADGGDEIFCGYERYWYSYNIGKKIFMMPKILRKSLLYFMDIIGVDNASKIVKIKNFEHKYNQLAEMLKDDSWKNIYEKLIHNSKNYEIKELLGIVKDIKEDGFDIGAKEHPMQGMMLWDYRRYMTDDILTKVDRATMSVSIEGREPLLDHKIAEFMAQVPFELKYKDGTSKYLLRKVLERYIPEKLIDRPKMGFGIPMFEWFGGDLKELFEKNFTDEMFDKHHLFNKQYIQKEYQKLNINKALNINKLWFILVFQLWYKKYMDN